MKIVGGPGRDQIFKSFEKCYDTDKQLYGVTFVYEYEGARAGIHMYITGLSPRGNSGKKFDFTATDTLGQTIKGCIAYALKVGKCMWLNDGRPLCECAGALILVWCEFGDDASNARAAS